MHGTKCDLVIKQGAEEKFLPTLYIENISDPSDNFVSELNKAIQSLPFDSLRAETDKNGFKIVIPSKYRVSHEEHFGQVTRSFLEYLEAGKLPDWEVPGMITKYFTTTQALKMALNRE